jgi:DNA-binding LacI/PurR family transcriptional regulator
MSTQECTQVMKRNRPTQADVARLAGVSQTTVSMVLNRRDGGSILISEETVEKVHEAMRALGYSPDLAAQMLAQGRNNLLGVFNYDSTTSYLRDGSYHKILVGVENGADQHGYNILLHTRNRSEAKRSIFQRGVNTLRLADGAILMGLAPNHEELQRLTHEGYPFVYIGRRDIPEIEIDWVISDYYAAGMQATRHLIELGHRNLAYICERSSFSAPSSQERWRGCQAVVAEVPEAQITQLAQSAANPAQLNDHLQTQGITALICNDAMNFREVMRSLPQTGLRVPQDVSILALGDTMGDFATSMKVTYVRLNQEMVGELAVKRLVTRLEASASQLLEHTLVPCEFIVGDTTGARGGT